MEKKEIESVERMNKSENKEKDLREPITIRGPVNKGFILSDGKKTRKKTTEVVSESLHLFIPPPAYYNKLALDISDHSIEFLRLDNKKRVLEHGRKVIEKGIIEDGEILNEDALAAIFKSLGITGKLYKTMINVPESKTFIELFKMEVPANFSKEKIKSRIEEKMIKLNPLLVSTELYLDHTVISSKKKDKRLKEMKILCAATPKELIDKYVKLMRSQKMEPIIFGLESLSLAKALLPSDKERKGNSIMIMDIGAKKTVLSVFNGEDNLSLSSTSHIAGDSFNRKIADDLGISIEEAKKMKKSLGFLPVDDEDNKILPSLQYKSDKIASEATKAIRYYKEEFDEDVSGIILAGGSSLIFGIESYLSDKIGLPVEAGNPLSKISNIEELEGDDFPILFTNVIGLALRGTDRSFLDKDINLIPFEIKKREKRILKDYNVKFRMFVLFIFLSGMLIFVSTLIFWFFFPDWEIVIREW